ncbi:unnamed protein product [Rotaria sp. Silwood2]|nr:unnamed protein product [Rotaria sp. Silwood2]
MSMICFVIEFLFANENQVIRIFQILIHHPHIDFIDLGTNIETLCHNNLNPLLCFSIAYFYISATTTTALVLPSQCYEYTIINDGTRHVNAAGSNNCDTIFLSASTWIRFIGESGTQLSTSPTNPNQCGTQVTGWYSGRMPFASETITDGRVCFSWENNICQWSKTISITNCGSFYIYKLTMPPLCAARYCTNTPNIITTTSTTTTTTTSITTTTTTNTAIISPQCHTYAIIDDPSRSVNANGYGSQCDQQNQLFFTPNWFRFIGSGGTQIPTSAANPHQCSTSAAGWYSGIMPSMPDTTVPTTTATLAFNPQCYSYTAIDDPSRNVNGKGYSLQCDQDNPAFSTPNWFRFIGTGGTQIPTSIANPDQCGTNAAGWYSGIMPAVSGTTATGTVCYSWGGSPCSWSNDIQVTNCGSFYVYKLSKPPICSARYCTDTPVATSTTPTTSITTTTSTLSSQCYNYETIDDETRNKDKIGDMVCDQNLFSSGPRWVRFIGAGGTQIPTEAVRSKKCGTQATGWYSGEMPNVFDTTTNGNVCFAWESNACAWKTNILVTNCGSYYVYQLIAPPVCNARYCTANAPAAKITKRSSTAFTSISSYIRSLFKKLTE